MRATCEFSEKKNISELPYIRCRIFKTENDITIKISDLGGGIKRESSGKLFKYSYSTAPKVPACKFRTYNDLPIFRLKYLVMVPMELASQQTVFPCMVWAMDYHYLGYMPGMYPLFRI